MTHVYPYLGPHLPHIETTAEEEHLESGKHTKDWEFEKRWHGVFKSLDKDKSGKVPIEHLKQRLQEGTVKIPTRIRDNLLADSALNKTGHLDYHKFLRLLENVDQWTHLNQFRRGVAAAAYSVLPKSDRPQFVESELTQYNCLPPPVFLLMISVAELAVFLYYYCTQKSDHPKLQLDNSLSLNNSLVYSPYRRKEAWRLLSYMLLHAGWWHLTVNLLVQLGLGIPLELVHKYWRVGIVYIFGVIAGALGTSVTDPTVYLVGASAGGYALIAAHLASMVINWREMEYNWLRLICWLLLVGVDVGVAFYYRYFYTGPERESIGYAAHFSGALCGLLLGVVTLRCLKDFTYERVLWWISLVLTILLFLFAILWNVFWPKFPAQQV